MPLSWNEIRDRSIRFSKDYAETISEQGERQSFWNDFFEVFGMKRRMVASFEEPVRKISGQWGYIDLFWKGTLLVEHKSRGKSLDKAQSQAQDYVQGLINDGRREESPRYLIISDFENIALHDLDEGSSLTFELKDFHQNIHAFGFIPGYKQHKLKDVEDPINIRAVELMGELHDALDDGGYSGHDLERFLVRILFCLFAEDTGIFDRNSFTALIENHTRQDGSDLGPFLAQMFQVLNTPTENRQRHLLEELADLPYVNGDLFAENLGFASLNRSMRDQLLRCCNLDWSRISPGVFGSLFQSVMEPKERRQVGAHYTSERDILKLINGLFMDDLREEFDKVKGSPSKLRAFHEKLGSLRYYDPACGCGNFLVVTYRELRLLELEVLKVRFARERFTDVGMFCRVDVDCMYGIEINEFPALIAEVAMWLIDHQMNLRLSQEFGQYFIRLPLKKSAKIVHGNALRIDWADVVKPVNCSYILGNPPFVGSKYQTKEQREDMKLVAGGVKNYGLLDYVTGWYFKAMDYIAGTNIQVAFVSTNSICQGEQVGVLWSEMFKHKATINFAHTTFHWQSEARGKAHVHVVIVGFSQFASGSKHIYEYDPRDQKTSVSIAKNISPYLVDGPNVTIQNRSVPLCDVPKMVSGNKPIDGGNYFFTREQRDTFINEEPQSAQYFKQWLGGEEFLNGIERWFLDLSQCKPNELTKMPKSLKLVENVRRFRESSKSKPTQDIAKFPTKFHTVFSPKRTFLACPQVSSERRPYIPMSYLSQNYLPGDKLRCIADADMYHFGVLNSRIHMAWVRRVTGRLKSDYQYSAKLVYNNYPWPQSPTDRQKEAVEARAQDVLGVRAKYPDASLADLYDPLTMPADLVKSHEKLDRAVEQCYRAKPFESDRDRVQFLFALYEQLSSPLVVDKSKRKRRNKDH
jgi:hypothetical protein